jgi:folate-binding protein YgfZ
MPPASTDPTGRSAGATTVAGHGIAGDRAGRPAPSDVSWGDPGPRGVLAVRGPDAVRFVDGFTTAAVSRLTAGSGAEAFFLDAKGWVLALAEILRTDDGLLIDVPGDLSARLLGHLEHYHIRERLDIVDESSAHAALVLVGPGAAAWLAGRLDVPPPRAVLDHVPAALGGVPVVVTRIDWYGAGGFRLRCSLADVRRLMDWLEAERVPRADARALDVARIEAGSPMPDDIPEKTLPQELGRNARAISFDKGCYLGQETVARLDALGHVNRRLVAVACDPGVDRHGSVDVTVDGRTVGRLTSLCLSAALGRIVGIGLLQVKAVESGRPLAVDGAAAAVVPLPVAATPHAPGTDHGPGVTAARDEPGTLLLEARRFSVVRVAERCADGSLREREVVRHPGSVVVVPLTSAHEVCLVEVVRVAVGRTLLELPAGTLDRVESLEEAARRELGEETGYRAGTMTSAGAFWMSPGILRERMHLFVAEDLVPGPQALEPGEQIRTRVVPWETAVAMCLDGRIDDAKTVAGILLIDARRRGA